MGGWVGGQAEYVHGALRRLEPAEVPRPRPGDGEDPRPDDAVGHLPDRLPRLRHRRASRPGSTVYIAGAGPVGLAAAASAQLLGAAVVIVGDLNERPARAGARASAARPIDLIEGHAAGPDRADPRRAGGRRRRRRGRLRGARARRGRRHGGAGDGAQLAHGGHPGGRASSASPASTSPATRAPSTRPPRSARCRSASGSAGPSRTRSPPASAR